MLPDAQMLTCRGDKLVSNTRQVDDVEVDAPTSVEQWVHMGE